ncbi:MHYT domain-containing protein [Fischerella sp. PCC 9605]|uniref:MHYT domain-containing protein n=1 Tax=Fischerella sp. PCC 9605 TaxID=1173024 RepID=UPI00047AC1A2|nr:MHYT domain-containing protein [Fischerella sp. PCC 9605]
MQISYDLSFVALSVLIAVIGSYAVLGILPLFTQKENESRFTAVTAGVLMGVGIWTMHFIGMKALKTEVQVNYDILITVLSIFPAVIGASAAFYMLIPKTTNKPSRQSLLISALIMAISISIMHYTGMAAMMMSARITYDYLLFTLSIIIAFVASYISLGYFVNFGSSRYIKFRRQRKTFTAILMGITISLMHYTGMAATNFIPDSTVSNNSPLLLNEYALYGLAFYCGFMLIIVSLIVTVTLSKAR